MRLVWRLAASAAGALLLAGCSGKPHAEAPGTAPGPPLRALVVEPARTAAEWRLDGTVEATDHATVAAETSGRVEAIYYDVGDHVPAGAVIIRLRATEQHAALLQATASVHAASARALEAETRYRRIRDMYDRRVLPKAALDQATAERDAAAAQLSAARAAVVSAQQGVAYTEVRAPYAGVVTQRLVEVGETVAPGTPLMSGVSLQRLRVAVNIPQIGRGGGQAAHAGRDLSRRAADRGDARDRLSGGQHATRTPSAPGWIFPTAPPACIPACSSRWAWSSASASGCSCPRARSCSRSAVTAVYLVQHGRLDRAATGAARRRVRGSTSRFSRASCPATGSRSTLSPPCSASSRRLPAGARSDEAGGRSASRSGGA